MRSKLDVGTNVRTRTHSQWINISIFESKWFYYINSDNRVVCVQQASRPHVLLLFFIIIII